ncbi:MAG: RagB/SusD family nutrient uptake outer membrane protein [Prevotella sp.]|nr:RagB/SusD family nutrient uptake outer membrane protein [Prevotella sp.]MDY4039227.1 RagB/SusD family nutrient uptake outer membrane protein [Prevotella sp.]
MKKQIIIAATMLISLSGCNDFLDRSPLSDLSPENYFKDKTEMTNWNAGIYGAFQSALQRNQAIWGDCRSDNIETTGYVNNNIYMNALTPTMSESNWQSVYQCITRCNTGIKMYPTIPNVLESEYAPYMAQAYGMRAFMYFYATRVWGRLPIVNDTWDGNLNTISTPRASLDEVKAQILADIDQAINYFMISNTSSVYYLSLAAMYDLRTEVYMWYHEYNKALEASNYFINNKNYSLAADEVEWKAAFENPEGSKEDIFAMSWSYINNGASSGWPGLMGASNTNNGYQMAEPLFDELIDRLYSGEGKDARLWCTLDTIALFYNGSRVPLSYASYNVSGIQKCIKYSLKNPNAEYDANNQSFKSYYTVLNTTDSEIKQVFMRLSNVYYLRAEALNKLGRGAEALAIVNQLRQRVGYLRDATLDVSSPDNVEEIENLILKERQIEFYGEGQRWFDLMRTGKLVKVMGPIYSQRQEKAGVTVTGFGDEGTCYWPIYYREFESNKALEGDQNPPYPER